MTISKRFLIGFISGCVATLVLLYGGQVAALYLFYKSFDNEMDQGRLSSANLKDPPLPITHKKADLDWTVKSLNGGEVHLKNFQGKTLFLNFWATWCPPCVAEMPAIEDLNFLLQGDDVAILCIAEDSEDKVREFMEKNEYTFPVYLLQDQPPASFDLGSIPVTMVISPEGQVVLRHVGAANWSDQEFVDALKALAKNPGAPEEPQPATNITSESEEL